MFATTKVFNSNDNKSDKVMEKTDEDDDLEESSEDKEKDANAEEETDSADVEEEIAKIREIYNSIVSGKEKMITRFTMEFWIFMLIMDLLLPFTMIGFGRYFMKKAPKEINSVFGYRTSMSMKNKDTWEFAHKYCGKVWYVCGMVMLPITVIFMLLVIGKNEDCVGSMGGIICGVQLIPLIGSILPTEIALKKNFLLF